MNKSYFAVIPANVRYDEDLTPNAKLLYGEITALCNEKGYCWASNSYFADLYRVNKNTISVWIKQLATKGFISTEIIYKEGTKEIMHRYIRICGEGTMNNMGTPTHENKGTPTLKNMEDNNTLINNTLINNTVNKKRDINTLTKKAIEQEFEALWKLYPRKEGKKNALNSYIKARKEGKTTYAEVEKGIERYIEYIKARKKDKELIKHGSTWFNQHAWTDEYDAASLQIQQELSKFNQLMLNNMESPDDFFSLMGVGDQYESRRVKKVIDVS
jgi:hypothetical protein